MPCYVSILDIQYYISQSKGNKERSVRLPMFDTLRIKYSQRNGPFIAIPKWSFFLAMVSLANYDLNVGQA